MIQDLIKLSQSVARDVSAIQGAGGNTSVKNDDTMYVKSSGTLLSEMTSDSGWAKLDFKKWREDFKSFNSLDEDEFVQINTNNTLEGGRASIETGLHALLPHKYVLHTHSVYANVFLCGGKTSELIDFISLEADVQVITVPVCAPGLQLTTHLANKLAKINTTKKTIVVLLENHGIAVSSDDLDETTRIHDLLHNGVRENFNLAKFESVEIQHIRHFEIPANPFDFAEDLDVWKHGKFTLSVAKEFFNDPKVFFPDQVVYVNNKINVLIQLVPNNKHEDCIIYKLKQQQAQNTAEILASVLYLYENINTPCELSQNLCEYIANMSGEKYRQQLEK